jgi:hypothetical protein
MLEKTENPELFSDKQHDQADTTRYQNITYHKCNRNESVSSSDRVYIDFIGAVSEMENLDWTFVHNHSGFVNRNTDQHIQFVRLDRNTWYAENLINEGGKWIGCVWYCEADNKAILDTIRLFFEEDPRWFDSLSWKFKRVQYV